MRDDSLRPVPSKNVGLDLLRIWLSFEVVLDHYFICRPVPGTWWSVFLSHMCSVAVPCFMTMSFFLTYRRYAESDVGWLKRRYVRLLTPYLFWAVVYFSVLWFGVTFSETFRMTYASLGAIRHYGTDIHPVFTDLIWQGLLGSSPRLAMQFWFYADLLMITGALFLLCRFVAVRCCTAMLVGCVAFGLTFQYSGLNYWLFGDLPFESKWTLGRLCAMLPYAAIGLMLGSAKDRIDGLSPRARWAVAGFALWMIVWVMKFDPLPRPQPGLSYQGLDLDILACAFLAVFYFLPFNRLPAAVSRGVLAVSRYAMGVYCVHLMLGWLLCAYVFPRLGVVQEGIFSCVLIYVASWTLCWFVDCLPSRFTKALVV